MNNTLYSGESQSAREATQSAGRGWSLSLDETWLLAALLPIYLFCALLPLPPNDLWWHMAAGRIIAETGQIPTTNMWAYSLPADTPYYFQSWLGEWLLYQIWLLGDVPLLVLSRNLLVLFSYGLLGWHAWRYSGSGRAAALALLLGALMGVSNWTLRTQSFCWILFVLLLVLCNEYRDGRLPARWLALLPLLLALWVNLHGSFVAGLVLLAITVFGELLCTLLHRPGALGYRRWLWLALAAGAAAAATLLNPRGAAVYPYLQTMLENPALQRFFVEWQPPRNEFVDFAGFWFFLGLLGTAAVMAMSLRRVDLTDLLLYCAFAWLAIDAVRYVIWFGLVLTPILARHLAALGQQPWSRPQVATPPLLPGRSATLVLAAMVLALLPWFQPARMFGPQGLATAGTYRGLLSNSNPIAASEWLRQNPIAGRFYTDMSYSSYTIWALPDKQVFADLRAELFPVEVWQQYFVIGDAEDGGETRERWAITHMLLSREWQPELIAQLDAEPTWRRAYEDRETVIFVRRVQ